jgi:hypothetical protein
MPPLYCLSFFSTLSSSRRAITTTIGTTLAAAKDNNQPTLHPLSPRMRGISPAGRIEDLELGRSIGGGVRTPRGRTRVGETSGEKRRSKLIPSGLFRTPSRTSLRSSDGTTKSSPRASSRTRSRDVMGIRIRGDDAG